MICPNCKKEMTRLCYPTFPPQYGYECFSCGKTVDEGGSTITIESRKNVDDEHSPFVKSTSDIIEIIRSNNVVISNELCVNIASKCKEIFKAGLKEGSRIAISQYESTLILKLKKISEKLNGPSKAIIDALRTTLEENIK
jgi:hypothetical protein